MTTVVDTNVLIVPDAEAVPMLTMDKQLGLQGWTPLAGAEVLNDAN